MGETDDQKKPDDMVGFTRFVKTPDDLAEEGLRRKAIVSAVEGAKRTSAEILTYAKKIIGKSRIGRTTAEEDITAIHLILDGLMGGMAELSDTDAKPVDELGIIKDWPTFKKWAPDEAQRVEEHLLSIQEQAVQRRATIDDRVRSGELTGDAIDIEKSLAINRFTNETQRVDQLESWLNLAKEGLQRAFLAPPTVADDVQKR